MLSSRCISRNETIIPSLLKQHDAVLSGSASTIDLSTADNWHVKEVVLDLLREMQGENTENQICDPGDGILIATPYWAGLDISLSIHGQTKAIPVHVPLSEFFTPESIRYYESAAESSPVPITAVLRLDLHYISDEVYALSAHKPAPEGLVPFVSILEMCEAEMIKKTHIIYSISKDFGCSGIRVGALITQNEPVRLSAALSLHSQVSSLSTSFASKVLEEESITTICDHGGKQLKVAYEVMISFFETHRIEYISGGYGMFVFARLCPVKTFEEEQRLLGHIRSNGVSLSSGTSYHFKELGWFRLCYGVTLDQLDEALKRVHRGVCDHLNVA
ncbi:hypothetical protein N7541_000940 [Penicillium brevicompactum]|uniref:Aminotransferase class I/classII large domain-containing protein n=1 Tax=Penicillium brevicompactum TaxID=5074 RepID=A0A9W9V458_PENBR|nr:hypothetical protein N7541_000940 [Penicillium brevicompactum]